MDGTCKGTMDGKFKGTMHGTLKGSRDENMLDNNSCYEDFKDYFVRIKNQKNKIKVESIE